MPVLKDNGWRNNDTDSQGSNMQMLKKRNEEDLYELIDNNFQDILLSEKESKVGKNIYLRINIFNMCGMCYLCIRQKEKYDFTPKDIQEAQARNDSNRLFTRDGWDHSWRAKKEIIFL